MGKSKERGVKTMTYTYHKHPLKDEIYKRGFTIERFCLESDITKDTMYNIFKGKTKKVRGSTIYLMAQTLGLPYERVEELCQH